MICKKCNEDKGTDFRKGRAICRECENEVAREYRKRAKEKKKPASIICNVCNKEKTEFRIDRKKCLDCERAHGRKYRQTTDKAKIWATANAERMSELQHNWYERKKPEIQKRLAERRKTDPGFKLAMNHRKAASNIIAERAQSSKHINCSGKRLRNWVQFQFMDDMSFENYGTIWVVDHVIPIATFLTGEHPAKVILNWINIRPMYRKKNLKKNKYIDAKQCQKHLININHYCQVRDIEKDTEYCQILKEYVCDNSQDTLLRESPESSDYHPPDESLDGEHG